MKVRFNVSDNMTCEVEGDSQRDIFEQLAALSEVFGNDMCGKCKSTNIKYIIRTNSDDDKFYELQCMDCRAKLSFGCHKKGNSLFPHRKDKDEKFLPNNGWNVYVKPKE